MNEMRIEEVLAALPHNFPLILIDRVVDWQEGKFIAALKNVTFNEAYFRGHFPGNPVMPGVLILEALAQAGGLLILKSSAPGVIRSVSFVGVDGAKFRRPVFPGDQLRLRCEPVRRKGAYWKIRGQAFVEEDLAAEAGLFLAEVK
jgi:beta-hydroxyacyl-ACP dehydratase FabZ